MMWTCLRSGDCCEQPRYVVVTQRERRVLEAAAQKLEIVGLQWRAGERPSHTHLVARPCPFFTRDEAGQGVCRVYDERPYNCRRFMCGRTTTEESYDRGAVDGIPLRVLTSADLRQQYADNQCAAQAWADAHGWTRGATE